MTDLRAALIEAGAEAIDDRLDGDRWTTEQFAEACLDAFLDVLADRADELIELDPETFEGERQKFVITHAFAVLREGDE